MTAEFRLRHADGSWRDVEAVGQSFLHDLDVAGIVANYRDVTDRKRAEEAMRETEKKYRNIVETATETIVMVDAEARIVFVNDRWSEQGRDAT